MPAADESLFEVDTPLGFSVRTTAAYWHIIVTLKHPVMRDRLADVEATLREPDEIRRSRVDPSVYLFYRADGARRWVCAVGRHQNEAGFLVTAYRTSAIKEGVRVWPR